MGRAVLVTTGLVVALALGGCSDDEPLDREAVPSLTPAAPSPEPGATEQDEPSGPGRASFPFDVAFRADESNALVVRYGDSSSCPREQVDADVVEADTVTVTLSAQALGGGPCTADYAPRDVTVVLAEPLGDRAVVDGATGTVITVATGTPPGPPGSPVPLPPG